MSYIQDITTATELSSTGTLTSTVESDDIMGKEDFLTLLVAQLQNQDPLNPDDPTEFTSQLAEFSSLEQLYNINDSMESLAAASANSDQLSSLQTIGKDVAYYESEFSFEGESVEIGYQLDGDAEEVTLYLQQNGTTIKTIEATELTAGNHYITWDGLNDNGEAAATGTYEIVLSAQATEGASIAATPIIKSEVTGVDLSGANGGTLLTEAGEIGFSQILGIYETGSGTSESSADSENTADSGDSEGSADSGNSGESVDSEEA